MRVVILFAIGFLMLNAVQTEDAVTIEFIKQFIENERKPTHLICCGLCWQMNVVIKLVNVVSKLGIRASMSLEPSSKYQEHAILYLTDLKCDQSEDVIQQATTKNLFQFTYRWLILMNSTDKSRLPLIWESPFLPDSDLVLAERTGDQFRMVELHKPSQNASMQSSVRGHYNGSLVDMRPHRQLFRRRRDLARHTLTMSNIIQDSNTTRYHLPREDRLELQYDSVTKACWSAAVHMLEMLNATPQYIFSYRYGYKVNGKWSGMIDDLYSKRADFGTNCLIFKDRFDVVTYTDFVASMKMYFVFRQPPLAYVANVFSLPFSSNVWSTILVCTGIATFTLYLASKWEVTYEQRPTQLDGGICDAVLVAFSAVTQQGCHLEPRRAPGRIMVWVLFTALMALYAAYSANVVVLLQAPSHSIRTLAHLAQAKMTLAALDTDYNHFVLNQTTEPLHMAIRDRVFPEGEKPRLYSLVDGVERIRKGLFAMHALVPPVYRQIAATFLESEKCDVTQLDFINSFDSFTPVRKGSPYLELIRVVAKQVRESGLQSAILKRYLVPKPQCTTTMSAFSSVGITDLKPVLVIMLYGVSLSVLIATAEIIVFKLSRRRKGGVTINMKIKIRSYKTNK